MRKELAIAIKAVKAAAGISRARFGEIVEYSLKADRTPVTKADKLCEKAMLGIIRKEFPGDSILSEEHPEERRDSNRRWIIDPIDGTKSFMKGIVTFGNMAAFEEDGRIVAGAVTVPALGKIMYAEMGKGAYVNGKRIRVSNVARLSDAYILHGRGKGFLEKGYLKKLRKLLDAVEHSWGFNDPYAFYLLATGRVDAVVETFPHPWDVAAPQIIVEEAGGRFSDLSGAKTLDSNTIAIYSNGKIHADLINILKK